MSASFKDKLQAKWDQKKFVCIGLDKGNFEFDKSIIDQTFDLVCAYKPNTAFYEAFGVEGLQALEQTIKYIKEKDADIPIILDAKRGDIGNTNEGYVKAFFDEMKVDATTLHPYLGRESLQPFLDQKDKGIIILVKTSNPGSGEFQDLMVDSKPLYQVVAREISDEWNKNGNCAVVVGATYPEELKKVRHIIGDMPILIPGIGAQGGNVSETVQAGKNSQNQGIIISSSRGIIFDPDPRSATLSLHQEIVNSLELSS